MKEEAAAGPVCEVCQKGMAKPGDFLCGDCSRAFTLMLELLRGHPELSSHDLARVRDVFEWRMKKIGPHPVQVT
jgi:hypothetical protein